MGPEQLPVHIWNNGLLNHLGLECGGPFHSKCGEKRHSNTTRWSRSDEVDVASVELCVFPCTAGAGHLCQVCGEGAGCLCPRCVQWCGYHTSSCMKGCHAHAQYAGHAVSVATSKACCSATLAISAMRHHNSVLRSALLSLRRCCLAAWCVCVCAAERVQDGVFGAMMNVALENDGPVTFILDSGHQGSGHH